MPRLKVLFPYVGDSVGGSHVSSLILAQALRGTRYEPVVSVHEDGPLVAYLESHGITPLRAPKISYVAGGRVARNVRRIVAKGKLSRFLEANDIGIVHTQDLRMHMSWGPGARHAGVAHVWHQRNGTRATKHARAAVRADALLTVSQYCAKPFPSAMYEMAQVVYNPFLVPDPPDLQAARAALRSQLGLPSGTRIVLYIANFAPRKRPLKFVELAAMLARSGMNNVHFLMIGEAREPEGSAVRAAIAAAGLDKHCHLLGTQHPIEPWIAGADLLVAPAVNEAFGRTLVEAQLLGVPVLASDAGGHREIVQHDLTGVLVDPENTAKFAEEAENLLKDKHRATRLTQAACKDAVARFSVASHIDAITTAYDRVMRQ